MNEGGESEKEKFCESAFLFYYMIFVGVLKAILDKSPIS